MTGGRPGRGGSEGLLLVHLMRCYPGLTLNDLAVRYNLLNLRELMKYDEIYTEMLSGGAE